MGAAIKRRRGLGREDADAAVVGKVDVPLRVDVQAAGPVELGAERGSAVAAESLRAARHGRQSVRARIHAPDFGSFYIKNIAARVDREPPADRDGASRRQRPIGAAPLLVVAGHRRHGVVGRTNAADHAVAGVHHIHVSGSVYRQVQRCVEPALVRRQSIAVVSRRSRGARLTQARDGVERARR